MKRLKLLGVTGAALAVGAAFIAVLAIFANPFEADPTADGAVADSSGTAEGIEVHGDWVIEVRNLDGSLAERREFTNDLAGFGPHFLTRTLSRVGSPGTWAIRLPDTQPGGPCNSAGPNPDCFINEPIGSALDAYPGSHFTTLTISGDVNPEVVLQGTFDALNDGVIGRVETMQCFSTPPNANPAACNNTTTFTGTTLQAPINVLEGQQVLVTVRISFS